MPIYVLYGGRLIDKRYCPAPAVAHAASDLPAPAIQSFESYASPINDNVISSHRQRDRDLHASGSYDPRDTPAEFRKAQDGRRKHTTKRPRAFVISPSRLTTTSKAAPRPRPPRSLKRKPLLKNPLHPKKDRAIKAVVGSPSRRPSRAKQSSSLPQLLIQPRSQKFPRPRPPNPIQLPHTAAKSNQVPEHWSAEDKATFAKLPQEGQAFLLKRHGEMEAEFTRKSQASAGAVQFTQSLAPVFTDRRIQASLQQMGLNPTQAVQEWATFHIRAMSPDQKDKFQVLVDLTERMGLDPARIFSALNKPPLPEGLSEAELKDPAVKFFADRLGQTTGELNALRSEVQQRWAQENQARAQAGEANAKANIDQFADEVGADGKPLRPYFNTVLPIMLDLFKANPQRNMAETYDAACWAYPEVRKQLLAAEQLRQQSRHDVEKAKIAQRGNTRGLTSPAVKPPGLNGPSRGSLRDTIEQSAEEVGY